MIDLNSRPASKCILLKPGAVTLSLNLSHDKAPLGEMAWVEFALGFEHAFKLQLHADRVAQGEEKT